MTSTLGLKGFRLANKELRSFLQTINQADITDNGIVPVEN
jgi:hypothetical protein